MINMSTLRMRLSGTDLMASGDIRPSLRFNVAWTLVGNLGYALCQWGMLVTIAKLTNPETVGVYALALSIAAPVMMFTNLNLRTVQATDTNRDHPFSGYLAVRILTTILALLVIGAILLIAGYTRATAMVIIFVGLAKAAESVSDVYYGMMQQRERMELIAQSMLLRGGVSLAAMAVTILVTDSIIAGATALFFSWMVVLLGFDVVNGWKALAANERFNLVARWDWKALATIAWVSLPLGMVQLLISLNTNVPRYFIEGAWGKHELGVYAAISYLITGVSTIVLAVGNAVSPRLARMFHDQDFDGFTALLTRLIGFFVGLSVVGMVGAWWLGDFVLTHVYSAEYAGRTHLLVVLSMCFGLGAVVSMLGYGLTAARRFRSQVPLVAIALASTAVMGALLIPEYGAVGAAYGSLASEVVWTVGSGLVLARVIRSAIAQAEAKAQ